MVAVRPRRSREWLDPVAYWRDGGRGVVWFLADPKRTDLALVDPQSRRDVTRYRWSVSDHPVLSGTRPLAADGIESLHPGGLSPKAGA
jgi:hypothetical protein